MDNVNASQYIEHLQSYDVQIILPNGKVERKEIVGQVNDMLLANDGYCDFLSEYYLDPERIERYERENGGYIGTVESRARTEQNPEGYVKQITPEISERYMNGKEEKKFDRQKL